MRPKCAEDASGFASGDATSVPKARGLARQGTAVAQHGQVVKPSDRAAEMGSYDGSPKMFVLRLARSWDFDFHLFGQFWCGPKHDKSRKISSMGHAS